MPTESSVKNSSWWKRRTPMERHCTLITVAAAFLCGLLTTALFVFYGAESRDVCLTKGCVTAAHRLFKTMDFSVDPCDNFYEFVCGNFLKETRIPDDMREVSLYTRLRNSLADQVRSALDESSFPGEAEPYRKAKALYRACMDKDSIEKIGLTQIKELLRQSGGWPVMEGSAWDESKFKWTDTIYKFKDQGINIDFMFGVNVYTDLKNNTRRLIDIDEPSLTIDREYLVKGEEEKVVSALHSYMVDLASIFGADRKRAERELRESLQFEINLANITHLSENRRDVDKLYHSMKMRDLQENFPTIPWMEYIKSIMPKEVGTIYPHDIVNVAVPEYMRKFEVLLSKTPKRVQANYLMWRAVEMVDISLNEMVRDRQLKFSAVLNGKSQREPRWLECVARVKEGLPLAVASLYVKKFFKEEGKKNVVEITEKVQEQMLKILETVDWMDEKTRRNALEKAKAMKAHLAYPDEILDENKLTHYYENLIFDIDESKNQTKFMAMMLSKNKFELDSSLRKLRKKVIKDDDWQTHGKTAVVDAAYYPDENSIEIPAGILQDAFFSYDQPNYINYAGIGEVIGHEISHGFDDQGRLFDEKGNLIDWWEPDTKSAYLSKTVCIIQQYGDYTDEQIGLKLNGANTQGENIADNVGLKQAYHAYNSWVQQNGKEKRLPGLQRFSPHQLFWISAGYKECAKFRPESMKERILTDPHSPSEFRIRGPLSNLIEFANDFKCPAGSKMNPVHKCQVW